MSKNTIPSNSAIDFQHLFNELVYHYFPTPMINYHLERFETKDDKILYLKEMQIRFYHLTLIKCDYCEQTKDIPLLHTEARPNFHDYRISISNVKVDDNFKHYIYGPLKFNDVEATKVFNRFDILLNRTLMLFKPDPTFLTNWEEVKGHLQNISSVKNKKKYLLQLNSNFNNHPHYWGTREEQESFKKLLSAKYQKLKQIVFEASAEPTFKKQEKVESQNLEKQRAEQTTSSDRAKQKTSFAENNSNDFIKIEEVTQILKICKPTVYSYRNKGLIQSYKMGRNVYYKRSEIFEALNNGKVKYGKTK